jgi:hypothetical protein
MSGAAFYYFQNYAHGLGGSIALPKVLWLGYVLWFWYFLPLLIVSDRRISSQLRQVYWVFWLNMFLRAVVELWMMYFGQNWHPYYGIAHDLFSALFLFALLLEENILTQIDEVVRFNCRIMAIMFWIEAYFAWYMLQYVHSDKEPVYFVPGNHEHLGIMLVTWVVVIGLTIQQFVFARQWLYEPIERSSHSQTRTPG